MAEYIKNLSIKYRLMGWFSLFFVLALAVVGGVAYSLVRDTVEKNIIADLTSSTDAIRSMVQTSAKVSVRNRLRAIAEKNLDILASLEEQVRAGRMPEAKAKLMAERVLLSQSIGETGYIYTITTKGVIEVHPNKAMRGRDMSGHWLGQQQAQLLEGYLEYNWANPGETQERPKALYMAYFEPWDWIISVSSYREEFYALVDIDDFRSGVDSFRFGESGYAFIVTGQGEMVVHPWLTGDVSQALDANWSKLFDKMSSLRNGKLVYLWKDPGREEPRQKLMFFRYIPELDWIVASASYLDEVYAPLDRLRNAVLLIAGISLLLILPLSFYLGSSMTRPLSRLASRMDDAVNSDQSVRADENGPGEVGELARHFNQYMLRLDESRDGLRAEIEERIQAEQQLKLFEKVFENALEGISITDEKGIIVAVNPAFTQITGYQPGEVLGKNPRVLKSERHESDFYGEMWKSLKDVGSWSGEIWNRRKDGESYPEILSISSIRDDDGKIVNYVAVFHDISDMKLKDEQIEHQAYHDALTGLPNRILIQDRLSVSISHAHRAKSKVAVLFLDLDNFKDINDSLGHALGDMLIQSVAGRLSALYREEDSVARLGGDEFLITVVDVEDEREVVELAERLLSTFDEPFTIKGHELSVTPSIGVALYPDDGADPTTLIKNADIAMYQSKAKGKNAYFLFTQEMNDRISQRLKLESDMRQALKDKEFTVYFQPKVDIKSGLVVGMEALVRWHQSDGTVVSPADFIPLAEQTGLIVPLGEFILETSCKAMQVLDGIGCSDLKVSVNLSPLQFEQEDLVDMVLANLEKNGLPSSRLELEITESTLMTNIEASIAKLNLLVEHGVSISIDDFGTGYSSLYYLKNFPIDVIKVDQSFVRDITDDQSDAQIVETIILMARNLGIGVVAEGVETKEQLDLLDSFGCELVQGYYYSRPLPLEDVIEYLRTEDGACLMKS